MNRESVTEVGDVAAAAAASPLERTAAIRTFTLRVAAAAFWRLNQRGDSAGTRDSLPDVRVPIRIRTGVAALSMPSTSCDSGACSSGGGRDVLTTSMSEAHGRLRLPDIDYATPPSTARSRSHVHTAPVTVSLTARMSAYRYFISES